MKYYVILNGESTGPYEEAQLQTMGLKRDTMVWREGMQQWQRADSLQELSYLFGGNNPAGGYNQGGYNPAGGYNQGGYNQGGYNPAGYNQGGYNQGGYNQGGYNPGNYNQGGYNPTGGYNQGGYNPGGYNTGGRPPMPESYLVWAILATILCCVPLGIVSIVNAAGVSSAYNAGDYDLAVKKSENAKKWAIISAVCGIVASILYAIILIAEGSSMYY